MPRSHHVLELPLYGRGRVTHARGHVASLGYELVINGGVLEHG